MSIFILSFMAAQSKAVISYSPGGAHVVKGVMINVFPEIDKNKDLTSINGLELEISPASLILCSLFWFDQDWFYDKNLRITKRINGLHLGIVDLEPSVINGLEFNVVSVNNSCNGISLAAFNLTNQINGLSISLVKNRSDKCKGVQIGLFNQADELNGFQFGLWNKNQKRSLPFINWNFSSDD